MSTLSKGGSRWILEAVPDGGGRALDLGGGTGLLRQDLAERGYLYTNVDAAPVGSGGVRGNAHCLPFAADSFDLVVSSDSLEHFTRPDDALNEVHRILRPGGRVIVWVPFLHPFHGDDLYRYTPLGLRYLLEAAGFGVESISSPLWLFTFLAELAVGGLRKLRLPTDGRALRRAGEALDGLRRTTRPAAYAPAYLAVAVA